MQVNCCTPNFPNFISMDEQLPTPQVLSCWQPLFFLLLWVFSESDDFDVLLSETCDWPVSGSMMFSGLIHVVTYCTRFFLFNVSVIFYSVSVPASRGKSERDWTDHTATVSSLCLRRVGMWTDTRSTYERSQLRRLAPCNIQNINTI